MSEPKIDLSRVEVISWDVDGTLYSLHSLMGAFKRDLFWRMLSLNWFCAWRDFFRLLRFKMFMDRIRKQASDYAVPQVPNRDAISETQNRMYRAILPGIGLLPGILDVLRHLQGRGFKQVVLSDYRTTGKLDALGVTSFFSDVYAGEDLGNLKPAPEVFHAMLADLDIPADRLLHIGDRVDTDGGAADAVGYQVIILGRDVDHPSEILSLLGGEE